MLQNWLEPADPAALGVTALPEYAFGRQVRFFSSAADLSDVQIGLIGIDAATANAVRTELYRLCWATEGLVFADLGNARKSSPDFLTSLLRELLDGRIFPLLIGDAPQALQSLYQAFLAGHDLPSLVCVDDRAPFSLQPDKSPEHYLNIALHRRARLFSMGLIGLQAHFVPPPVFDWLERHHYECVRLGRARAELAELEPLLRDADLLGFHLRSLKNADAPAQRDASPSGFTLEESCQLCRYAGMSDKLRAFSLYGFDAEAGTPAEVQRTIQGMAQMIWYFAEGFYNRKSDYPATNEGLTEYIVDSKGRDGQIVFWKSNKSSRWWIQVPVRTARKYDRHRLIPCSYSDYVRACNDELPDRIVNAFKRF